MSDSRVINIAGRQRMFSQRLAKTALLLSSPSTTGERRRELLDTEPEILALWRRCHLGLQRGDEELGLPGRNSAAVLRMFAQVDDEFQEIAAGMEQLFAIAPRGTPTDEELAVMEAPLQRVLEHEASFLAGMDAIVFQYDSEAHARVARLRAIEWLLVALTLAVLLVEGAFVFRPAVRRLAHAIARLRRTRRELKRSRDEARAANEAKTRFLANVSHELRTPLNAIIGMTDLARTTESPTKRAVYLQTVAEASKSLLLLLNDLIDVSRVDANQLRLEEETVEVARLVRGAAGLLLPAAEEKGLDLRVEIARDAPAAIIGDELRLRQVLVNLLSNAVKFTSTGHVSLSCERTAATDRGDMLKFTVSDSGMGISAEDQRRIFEHFYQVDDRAGQAGGGVGLGLAISSKLASLMGGVITVESTPGAGSKFQFDLPLRPASAADPVNVQVVDWAGGRQPLSAPPLRVLIVEDSPVNQLLARESLEAVGHYVEAARDGREAALLLAAKEWDAAVVDIGLPDTTGWDVIRSVRERERSLGTPRMGIVVCTAHAGPDTAGKGRASECDAMLVKPFTPRKLQTVVAAAVNDCTADEQSVQSEPMPEPDDLKPGADEEDDLNWAFAVERLGGDEAMAVRLLQVLSRELSAQRGELAALGRRRDRTQLKLLAHRLGGQVANFEAAKSAAALARLEAAAAETAADLARPLAVAQSTLERLAVEVRDKMAEVRDQPREMPVL